MTDVRVFFCPKDDITLPELVKILRVTVFRHAGDSTEFLSWLPAESARHFEIKEL